MAKAPAASPAGSGEDDPQQLMAQLELVQRELQRMDRRLAALEQAVAEAQQAASTVAALAEAQGAQETLLPIGAGVHVHAKVDGGAPVLMPIGAGYFVEDQAGRVAEALAERVKALTKSFQDASADAERLAQAGAALNERLGQLSSS